MHELGAQLDWIRTRAVVYGENAAADPIARFEHDHVDAAFVKSARRGQAGDAGTDHDDVGVRVERAIGHELGATTRPGRRTSCSSFTTPTAPVSGRTPPPYRSAHTLVTSAPYNTIIDVK